MQLFTLGWYAVAIRIHRRIPGLGVVQRRYAYAIEPCGILCRAEAERMSSSERCELAQGVAKTLENGCEALCCIRDGWFLERGELWPGQALALQVQRVVYSSRSRFQEILVFDSKAHGRVLVLDGAIQVTERDEFAYQEMITHVPMFLHARPERVLVVGGGDGGVLREVLRHDNQDATLAKAVLCELDEEVIRVSRKYLPGVSGGALEGTNPKVSIEIMDGAAFMQQHQEEFDVIITDSSDPLGPAESLYQEPFFRSMYAALRDGGVACIQGESIWLHLDLIARVMHVLGNIFDMVDYASASVPTYPSGQIGFLLCGKGTVWREGQRPNQPLRLLSESMQRQLRYYSPEMHKAAFVLPPFVERAIASARNCPSPTQEGALKPSST